MPANAGIQVRFRSSSMTAWIPASAGMTGTRVDFQSTNSQPLGFELRAVQLLSVSSPQLGQFRVLRKRVAPCEVWNRRVNSVECGASRREDKSFRGNSDMRSIRAPAPDIFCPGNCRASFLSLFESRSDRRSDRWKWKVFLFSYVSS